MPKSIRIITLRKIDGVEVVSDIKEMPYKKTKAGYLSKLFCDSLDASIQDIEGEWITLEYKWEGNNIKKEYIKCHVMK